MTLIELFRAGALSTPGIVPTAQLQQTFERMWYARVRSGHYQCDVAKPFFHMRTEPFWQLMKKAGHEHEAVDKNQMCYWSRLQEAISHANIDGALADCLAYEAG